MTQEEFIGSLSPQVIEAIQEAASYYADCYDQSPDKFYALKQLYKISGELANEMPADLKADIKCKKGCAFCCHIRVVAMPIEAELAVQYATENNIEIDHERLKQQQDLDIDQYMFSPHRKCVFLADDNTCKIYEIRPFACRNYLVASEPELCNVDVYPKGQVAVINDINIQTPAIGLMMTQPNKLDSYPKLILKALHEKEKEIKRAKDE